MNLLKIKRHRVLFSDDSPTHNLNKDITQVDNIRTMLYMYCAVIIIGYFNLNIYALLKEQLNPLYLNDEHF